MQALIDFIAKFAKWIVDLIEQFGWGINKIINAAIDFLFYLPFLKSSKDWGIPSLGSLINQVFGVIDSAGANVSFVPWDVVFHTITLVGGIYTPFAIWKIIKLAKP